MEIRNMEIDDYHRVYQLWLSTPNMGLNDMDDSPEGIARYLSRNPNTCLVAEENGEIVGVILSGHDGRRGLIHHMAVASGMQRQGLGTQLLEQALLALKAEGIHKVALTVFQSNEKGNTFWEKQGFTAREDLTYRNRALSELKRIDT